MSNATGTTFHLRNTKMVDADDRAGMAFVIGETSVVVFSVFIGRASADARVVSIEEARRAYGRAIKSGYKLVKTERA